MELKNLFKKATEPSQKNQLRKKMKEETISVHEIFNKKNLSLTDKIQRSRNEQDMAVIIDNSFIEIIDSLCGDINFYSAVINNKLFLSTLITITSNKSLTDESVIKINGFCRRYISYDAIKASDDSIKDLIYLLSKVTCSAKYNKLVNELKLSEQIASDIILYSTSNEDEIISVQKLNSLLVATMQNNIFTSQMIIKIYETMFSSMKTVLLAVMLDRSSNEELIPKKEIQQNIVKATLVLLESMGVNSIYYILKDCLSYMDKNTGKINIATINRNIYRNIMEAYNMIMQEEGLLK